MMRSMENDERVGLSAHPDHFKPTADGFDAKMAVYWPENTVDEIVSGHCLHLITGFYGGLWMTGKLA